ncbi:MAG: hypothetical protein GVX78_04350 [Bacteroidetes bacterium]|nr:hypothetical protein [Bacteroidota bacterium]
MIFIVHHFWPFSEFGKISVRLLALFLLLVVGIWDDTRPLNPWIKMIWQLVAAIIMIVLGETYLSDLFGLFGFENLSMSMSYIISILLTLTIINGINLLDGINGLSATLTIILSFFFFFWFLSIQHYVLALFSCTLCAATIAFLWYNWTPASIFMGDSGAMILGLSISFLTLSFLQTDSEMIASKSPFAILHAPKIVISALLLPIIDTTRVFFIRLLDGTSPLSADRNHLHHKFVDAGYSDVQTTLILSGCQLGLILIALGTIRLSYLNSFMIMSICLLGVYLFFSEVLKKAEGTG